MGFLFPVTIVSASLASSLCFALQHQHQQQHSDVIQRSTTHSDDATGTSAHAYTTKKHSQQPIFPYTIQVGNPSYVLYPNALNQSCLPDMSTLVLNFSQTLLRGYTCYGGHESATVLFINGTTLGSVLTGYDASVLNVSDPHPFAADIEGAVVDPADPSHVFAFYHRENGWYIGKEYYYNGVITFGESRDMGLHFTPVPNDNNNTNTSIIIQSAGPANPGQPANTGTGPNWALLVGEYIYVYTHDAFGLNSTTQDPIQGGGWIVARSLLSSGCGPGTWYKYLNGEWTSPGIGGNATALEGLGGSKIIYLQNAQLFVSVSYGGTLSYSADGLSWFPLGSALFPVEIPHGQDPTVYWKFANAFYYTSLIPGYGGTTYYEKEDSLYLYYLFAAANNVSAVGSGERALAAMQLTFVSATNSSDSESESSRSGSAKDDNGTTGTVDALSSTSSSSSLSSSLPFVVLSLSQYLLHSNSSSVKEDEKENTEVAPTLQGKIKDTWATVWPVDQRVYDYGWHIAYVFASASDWTSSPIVPLLDCYYIETNDHFVGLVGECNENSIVAARDDNQYMVSTPPHNPEVHHHHHHHQISSSSSSLTVAFLGPMGYLLADNSTTPTGYQLISIWRCYDQANQDHYLAPVYGCQSTDIDPVLLGYALWQND